MTMQTDLDTAIGTYVADTNNGIVNENGHAKPTGDQLIALRQHLLDTVIVNYPDVIADRFNVTSEESPGGSDVIKAVVQVERTAEEPTLTTGDQ